MCGRFVLFTDLSIIADYFDIREFSCNYKTGANISPGQEITAVTNYGIRRLVNFSWGLIPSWAKDPSVGRRMFNARAETIAEKPSFKTAFKRRRCLIVADGFYEWQKLGKVRKPFFIGLKSEKPFAFAGLYESWRSPDNQQINTCTIITTRANELIMPIHDRMPVLLPPERWSDWIDHMPQNEEKLLALLKPYPAEKMKMDEAAIL